MRIIGRRFFLSLVLGICILGSISHSGYVRAQGDEAREKAENIVLKNVFGVEEANEIVDKRIYMSPGSYSSTEVSLNSWREEVSIPERGKWFVAFVDDDPTANWEHKARYILVNPSTNEIKTIRATSPPELYKAGDEENLEANRIELEEITEGFEERQLESFNALVGIEEVGKEPGKRNYVLDPAHQHAVLINGGYDRYNNHIRYWGDLAYIYTTLTGVYNYTDANIHVLNSDGTSAGIDRSDNTSSPLDLNNDGTNDIDSSATKSDVQSVFTNLQSTLTNADILLVFVTNHGGQEAGVKNACIWLWNKEKILDTELQTLVAGITCKKMIFVLETCFSGGFVDNLSGVNRMVATACAWDDTSVAGTTYPYYDQFVYYWTAAVRGNYPAGSVPWGTGGVANADADSDGQVTIKEAFDFAYLNKNPSDVPQYDENPAGVGSDTTLAAGKPDDDCSNLGFSSSSPTLGQLLVNLGLMFSAAILIVVISVLRRMRTAR